MDNNKVCTILSQYSESIGAWWTPLVNAEYDNRASVKAAAVRSAWACAAMTDWLYAAWLSV